MSSDGDLPHLSNASTPQLHVGAQQPAESEINKMAHYDQVVDRRSLEFLLN